MNAAVRAELGQIVTASKGVALSIKSNPPNLTLADLVLA